MAHLKQHKHHGENQQQHVGHGTGELRQHHGRHVHNGVGIEAGSHSLGRDVDMEIGCQMLHHHQLLFQQGTNLWVDAAEFIDRAGDHRHQHHHDQDDGGNHQRNRPAAAQTPAHQHGNQRIQYNGKKSGEQKRHDNF